MDKPKPQTFNKTYMEMKMKGIKNEKGKHK